MLTTECKTCGKNITGYKHYYCDNCYRKIVAKDIMLDLLYGAVWSTLTTSLSMKGIRLGAITTLLLLSPVVFINLRHKGNKVKGLENITYKFNNLHGVQVMYNTLCRYVIIIKGSEVLFCIDKKINYYDFEETVNNAFIEYVESNMSFSKQFIIADSDSDFRQHNLSMIYNGDNSVKLKTSLSEYSPNQPLTVFINNLEIGSIPNTDLKYFQKPNYNPQISKVNISVSTNTDNIKTYKATVTVNFTVIKKPAVRVTQNAVSLVECPKCKTLNSFSNTNCTICNTPLFIEDINKTEQNEQNK